MSIISKIILIALLFAAPAWADGVGGGSGQDGLSYSVGNPDGIHFKKASGSGPTGNDLLLSDGSSFLLLSDGSSKLCLASGC